MKTISLAFLLPACNAIFEGCNTAILRLKEGPEDWPKVI